MSGQPPSIKLLTIGDSAVGKTCLILRFAKQTFNPTFITTIGIDYKIKKVDVKGQEYKLLIWDTAGQERFRTITTSYFRGCQGILMVYDITCRKSFESVRIWMDQIRDKGDANVDKVLMGNKCDMGAGGQRAVTTEEGEALAAEYGIKFFETSAKEDINVNDAFMAITEAVVDRVGPQLLNPGGGAAGGQKLEPAKAGKEGKKGGCC